ncbi:GNAT family N-acetyltransferase [Saccharicrinis sp. FJH2]|uniref:GNAT family N-acetyltransferase n=1 Tax=unclassified Saccharicrinis TaxID=2646859 RepID=UPI0035D41A77
MGIEQNYNMLKADVKDLPEIMTLVRDAKEFMHSIGNFQWDDEYPLVDTFEKDINSGSLYKMVIDSQIAGFICLNLDQPPEYFSPDWKTPPKSLVIHRMVINRNFAGSGLGQKMMQYAEELTSEYGVRSLRSDTNCKNKPMLHIFEKMEYRYTGNIVLRKKKDLFCCFEKWL